MSKPKDLDGFKFEFDPGYDIFGDAIEGTEGDGYTDMDSVPGADPGVFLPNTEGRTEFLPPDPDRVPTIDQAVKQNTPEYASRPAIERTKELFGYMYPHRMSLYAILEAAQQPISNDAMEEVIKEIQQRKFSVYAPTNLCTMLETAGALQSVTEEGEPYERTAGVPDIVVEDGEEYYVPTSPAPIYWLATEAGTQMLNERDPEAKLKRQLEGDKKYWSIYKRVMRMASADDGVSMPELSVAVDKDPLISKPQRIYFVQHFVELLERCEAIAWNGKKWKLTELGMKAYQEDFADVAETEFQPDPDAKIAVSTETQGVRW